MKIVRSGLKQWLTHPLVRGLDVEGASSVRVHRQMIRKKPLLKWLYRRWYRELIPHVRATAALKGPMVEIGSGSGFLDKVIPGVLRTDSVKHPYSDRIVDANQLPFGDGTLRCLFMVNVMHHLEEPARFLAEAQRCLMPGGRVVLVEPHVSPFNRMLCSGVEHYEHINSEVREWKNLSESRMLGANLALPWVIFCRDRAEYEKLFPQLKVIEIRQHTFLAYAVTGGMTFRAFLPVAAVPLLECIEWAASPLMPWLGTTMTVVLEKPGLVYHKDSR